MTAISRPPDPLRDGRFGWLVLDARVVRDRDDRDVACALITAAGHAGDPAEQAMPALAETFGLNSRPGAHTAEPGTVYVTFADQHCATLHVGDDLQIRRAVPPLWQQAARTRGWVRPVNCTFRKLINVLLITGREVVQWMVSGGGWPRGRWSLAGGAR